MKGRFRTLVLARVAVSAAFIVVFAVGVMGSGAALNVIIGFIASAQLFPGAARLLGNDARAPAVAVSALAITLCLSAVFGRVYCSALCPLGTMQDAAMAAGRRGGKRPFRYARARPLLRATSFAAAAIALGLGAGSYAAFLDPYSLSVRFMQYAARPALQAVAGLASVLARSLGFYWRAGAVVVMPLAVVASAAPVLLLLVAARSRGRLFCTTLCPVGSVLGAINRIAVFRVRLSKDRCTSCGACAAVCKSACIDTAGKALDAERCVSCFSCLPVCPAGALRYGPEKNARGPSRGGRDAAPALVDRPAVPSRNLSRRSFLRQAGLGGAATAMAVLSPGAVEALSLAGFPVSSVPSAKSAPAAPPGAGAVVRFLSRCTACGLCVARCPSGVLRPSINRYGVRGLLAPYLDYVASYCQYECAVCMELCPTGALGRMSLPEKKLVQMGTAALVREKCIVITEKTACGACAEHCPTGAVKMAPLRTGIPEPLFDESICIGCGACHHVCPAEPDKAITVSGKAVQGRAEAPTKDLFSAGSSNAGSEAAEGTEPATDGFPF